MVTYSPGRRTDVIVPQWFPKAYEGLGGRLRQAREDRGMTQANLCRAIGMTRPQLSRYENERSTPSVLMLAAIAVALEESLDWIVYGRGLPGRTP